MSWMKCYNAIDGEGGVCNVWNVQKSHSVMEWEKRLKVNLRRSTWIQTRAKGIAGFRMEQGPAGWPRFFRGLFFLSLSLCLSPLLIKVFG